MRWYLRSKDRLLAIWRFIRFSTIMASDGKHRSIIIKLPSLSKDRNLGRWFVLIPRHTTQKAYRGSSQLLGILTKSKFKQWNGRSGTSSLRTRKRSTTSGKQIRQLLNSTIGMIISGAIAFALDAPPLRRRTILDCCWWHFGTSLRKTLLLMLRFDLLFTLLKLSKYDRRD